MNSLIEHVLIAEPVSVEALKTFAESETAAGRPTFFYDCMPAPEARGGSTKQVRLIYQPHLTPEEMVSVTKSGMYSGVMVRPKLVLPEVNVTFAVRVGTGINNFEEWRTKLGHVLMNTPGQNTVATAEYTVKALLRLMAPTHFDKATDDIRAGNLTSRALSGYATQELAGKRVAIIGMGDIGIRVAQILKGFQADVVGWGYTRKDGNASFSREDAAMMGIHWAASLKEAFHGADAATVHVPGSNTTQGLVDYLCLAAMRPGAVIVNAARGPIIDAAGLEKAVAEGNIRGFIADADWFGDEDADPLAPYLKIIEKYGKKAGNTLLVTPHIADATKESSYHGTMQGLKQLSVAYWERVIYNAQSALPEGYVNGGVVKPQGIGRVTAAEIDATVVEKRKELQEAAKTLLSLLQMETSLSPQQHYDLMQAANAIAHLLTNRPFE